MLFGWFVFFYLRLFPEGIIICDLRPIFQQNNLGLNKVLVCIYTFIYLYLFMHMCVHLCTYYMGKEGSIYIHFI